MVGLSIIFEDTEDGKVKVTFRSTKELPTDLSEATLAEIVLAEVAGFVGQQYQVKEGGIIDFSHLIIPEKPKIII